MEPNEEQAGRINSLEEAIIRARLMHEEVQAFLDSPTYTIAGAARLLERLNEELKKMSGS